MTCPQEAAIQSSSVFSETVKKWELCIDDSSILCSCHNYLEVEVVGPK